MSPTTLGTHSPATQHDKIPVPFRGRGPNTTAPERSLSWKPPSVSHRLTPRAWTRHSAIVQTVLKGRTTLVGHPVRAKDDERTRALCLPHVALHRNRRPGSTGCLTLRHRVTASVGVSVGAFDRDVARGWSGCSEGGGPKGQDERDQLHLEVCPRYWAGGSVRLWVWAELWWKNWAEKTIL